MNSKEKFLKAIEDAEQFTIMRQEGRMEAANQCTRINIEEKIELLDKLKNWIVEIESSPFALSAPRNELRMLVNFKDKLNKEISELTNELKQLEK